MNQRLRVHSDEPMAEGNCILDDPDKTQRQNDTMTNVKRQTFQIRGYCRRNG